MKDNPSFEEEIVLVFAQGGLETATTPTENSLKIDLSLLRSATTVVIVIDVFVRLCIPLELSCTAALLI